MAIIRQKSIVIFDLSNVTSITWYLRALSRKPLPTLSKCSSNGASYPADTLISLIVNIFCNRAARSTLFPPWSSLAHFSSFRCWSAYSQPYGSQAPSVDNYARYTLCNQSKASCVKIPTLLMLKATMPHKLFIPYYRHGPYHA